jgi:hypothetical protein
MKRFADPISGSLKRRCSFCGMENSRLEPAILYYYGSQAHVPPMNPFNRAQIFDVLLTCMCCSGIAQSPPSPYELHSVSPSASYSQCYCSSEEHGLCGWEQGLGQAELGKRLMVRVQRKWDVRAVLTKHAANFKRGDRPISTDGLRKVRTGS